MRNFEKISMMFEWFLKHVFFVQFNLFGSQMDYSMILKRKNFRASMLLRNGRGILGLVSMLVSKFLSPIGRHDHCFGGRSWF
jgi:hypothetical protein